MSAQLSITEIFNSGGLIAYPTEAVFGLGCDPDNPQALQNLLRLKNRPAEKGLILVASDYGQLLPYVNDNLLPQDKRFQIFSKWPGPVTWLLPKSDRVSSLLCGDSDKIAVRVPAFEPLRELCRLLGKPIVSTSANLSGQPPVITAQDIRDQFKDAINFVLDQPVGGNNQPSSIYDALSGQQLR